MIYLDNAATSFPKPELVINEVNSCIRKYCGNPGRSSHKLSIAAAEAIYSVREKVATHFCVNSPECVVFTYNATYALNIAIKTYVTKNCHVLISEFEHNSVVRPLEALKNKLQIDYSSFSSMGNIEENIRASLKANTTGIICSLQSNVFGYSMPLQLLSRVAKKYGLFLIVDASQAAGHRKINLTQTPCDVLCAPAHKALFGIQGCGIAIFHDNKRQDSFIEGGSGSESESLFMPMLLPEGYEAGTLSTPAIVSLGSGIDFIDKIGIENLAKKIELLSTDLIDRLMSIKGIVVYISGAGIVSFNYKNYPSSYIADLLDKDGICTRGGLHCAPMAHKFNATDNQGAVRASISYFNSKKCLDTLYTSMQRIASIH